MSGGGIFLLVIFGVLLVASISRAISGKKEEKEEKKSM